MITAHGLKVENKLLNVTLEEAFDFGKLEGTKEALLEVIELIDSDPQFVKKYCQARLKTLNDFWKITSLKRGLN